MLCADTPIKLPLQSDIVISLEDFRFLQETLDLIEQQHEEMDALFDEADLTRWWK